MITQLESNLWDNVLRTIKTKLQRESFETWFNPIRFEGVDSVQRLIRLRAPNQVVRDWVKINYANLIDQSFGELSLGGYSVDWILPEDKMGMAVPRVSAQVERPGPCSRFAAFFFSKHCGCGSNRKANII
jgi:chromosomal replication initiator protein